MMRRAVPTAPSSPSRSAVFVAVRTASIWNATTSASEAAISPVPAAWHSSAASRARQARRWRASVSRRAWPAVEDGQVRRPEAAAGE